MLLLLLFVVLYLLLYCCFCWLVGAVVSAIVVVAVATDTVLIFAVPVVDNEFAVAVEVVAAAPVLQHRAKLR